MRLLSGMPRASGCQQALLGILHLACSTTHWEKVRYWVRPERQVTCNFRQRPLVRVDQSDDYQARRAVAGTRESVVMEGMDTIFEGAEGTDVSAPLTRKLWKMSQ